jgi:hypothetical protein
MSGHFYKRIGSLMKDRGCKKSKRGKKGKSLALFAPFALFAANPFHLQIARNRKVSRHQAARVSSSAKTIRHRQD